MLYTLYQSGIVNHPTLRDTPIEQMLAVNIVT